MRMSFTTAAVQQVEEEQQEDGTPKEPWLVFTLADQEFVVPERPSSAQNAVVLAGLMEGGAEALRSVLSYLYNILEGDGGRRIRRLLERNQITFDVLYGGDEWNEEGVVDSIMSLATANPTDASSGSTESQPATGKRSTGRSPGKGSTLSN